jgi:hypothetical protein
MTTLIGIHFLLTYECTSECDHCFLYCGPNATGKFTLDGIRRVLAQAAALGTVEWIFYEGGEPFLYHPVVVAATALARDLGFKVGVVTNCYWATAEEDAALWLAPLHDRDLTELTVSDDEFHHGEEEETPAKVAARVAGKIGVPSSSICIAKPTLAPPGEGQEKGAPVVGGGAMFRGRAADKLTEGLPRRPWRDLASCPHEELAAPQRVHVDPFGYAHLCQGLVMGNVWETPLATTVREYDVARHPVAGPLARGGPAELARVYDLSPDEGYVDECHFCYEMRKRLLERFPEWLAPRQVYGLSDDE